jgi:hypothetical protein
MSRPWSNSSMGRAFDVTGPIRRIRVADNPAPLKRKEYPRCMDCGCKLDKKKKRCAPCFDVHQEEVKRLSAIARRAKAKEPA